MPTESPISLGFQSKTESTYKKHQLAVKSYKTQLNVLVSIVLCQSFNTDNERNERAQALKLNRISKEDQKLSLNSVILKSRSPLHVPDDLLL
jgi:hypothetical protein